jgi:hypothetical protein
VKILIRNDYPKWWRQHIEIATSSKMIIPER